MLYVFYYTNLYIMYYALYPQAPVRDQNPPPPGPHSVSDVIRCV